MAYIPKNLRATVNGSEIGKAELKSAAQLRYAILVLCNNYIKLNAEGISSLEISAQAVNACNMVAGEIHYEKVNVLMAQDKFDNGDTDEGNAR